MMANRQAYKHASVLCIGLAMLASGCAEKQSITRDETVASEPRARDLKYLRPMPPVVSDYCKALIEGPGGDWDKLPSRPANLVDAREYNELPDNLLSRAVYSGHLAAFFSRSVQLQVFNEYDKENIRNNPQVPLMHKYTSLKQCDGGSSHHISNTVTLCSAECEFAANIKNGTYDDISIILASQDAKKNTVCYVKSLMIASGLKGAWADTAKLEENLDLENLHWNVKIGSDLFYCLSLYAKS
ncbi:MAG: hypothetical protein ACK41P_05200 [Asticcacaulis sp.]